MIFTDSLAKKVKIARKKLNALNFKNNLFLDLHSIIRKIDYNRLNNRFCWSVAIAMPSSKLHMNKSLRFLLLNELHCFEVYSC